MATLHVQDGPLKTTIRDLALSVEWFDLRELKLAGTEWTVILGHKRRDDPLRAVLPLPLHTTSLRPSDLKAIFNALSQLTSSDIPPVMTPPAPSIEELHAVIARNRDTADHPADGTNEKMDQAQVDVGRVNGEIDAETIYMAIATTDSTVVYYRLSRGIKKPADIPDE